MKTVHASKECSLYLTNQLARELDFAIWQTADIQASSCHKQISPPSLLPVALRGGCRASQHNVDAFVGSAGLSGTHASNAEELYLDTTRISLDNESWSSSNADSDLFRSSETSAPRGFSPAHIRNPRTGSSYDSKPWQTSAEVEKRFRASSHSETGRVQRPSWCYAQPAELRSRELQEFMSRNQISQLPAERDRSSEGPLLSSQDGRHGLHLRDMPRGHDSARPSSGPLTERSERPGHASSGAYARLHDTQPIDYNIQLGHAQDFRSAEMPTRPPLTAQQRHRALQTAPYSYGRPQDSMGDLHYAGDRLSPAFDESLQWIVGVEDAKHLQHAAPYSEAPQAEMGSHSKLQPENSKAWSIHQGGPPSPPHPHKITIERSTAFPNGHSSAAERSLHTQPYSLDMEAFTRLDPLRSQPMPPITPMHDTSPRPHGRHFQKDAAVAPLPVKPFELKAGKAAAIHGQRSLESQQSTPSGRGGSYDYTIASGRLPQTGDLQIVYEAQSSNGRPGHEVPEPSLRSEHNAKGLPFPRATTSQQV